MLKMESVSHLIIAIKHFLKNFLAMFTFVSRRHRGSPFGLTINLNGVCNIRVSSCCEYKHNPGYKIGGKNSRFALVSVQGAAPCYR